MDIRLATALDLPALVRLDSYAAAHVERQAEIAGWIDQGVCHVGDVGGKPVAYGVLTNHFFGQAFITLIVVGAGHRRSGLGLRLVRHFQDICRGSKLFTSTNRSNHSMQRLLLKAGFKPSGQIDNLDDDDPELVFFCPPA
ncbi:GNAT family N-acetyltransferase [Devosia aquimaris]|uniref:GNAT family N-acetyltransferase n=1 Tax=Devosia aquimaris TaxID=2866214 RepID=UPI001CD15698|nr:GNAT family N-acetyltransferase [Devosia sp. CJK-A8-3]